MSFYAFVADWVRVGQQIAFPVNFSQNCLTIKQYDVSNLGMKAKSDQKYTTFCCGNEDISQVASGKRAEQRSHSPERRSRAGLRLLFWRLWAPLRTRGSVSIAGRIACGGIKSEPLWWSGVSILRSGPLLTNPGGEGGQRQAPDKCMNAKTARGKRLQPNFPDRSPRWVLSRWLGWGNVLRICPWKVTRYLAFPRGAVEFGGIVRLMRGQHNDKSRS